MISRGALYMMGYCVTYFGLFLGGAGQIAFLSPLLKEYLPGRIGMFVGPLLGMVPFLILFTITYTNVPLVSARTFRRCVMFCLCWIGTLTLGAELIGALGLLPPESPKYARSFARVFMHFSWLTFPPLIALYRMTPRDIEPEEPRTK